MEHRLHAWQSWKREKVQNIKCYRKYNREALTADPDYSFASEKVAATLKRLIEWRVKPEEIRIYNGPEFTAKAFQEFCQNFGIIHKPIQRGEPMQIGYIERFNITYPEDVLDSTIFSNLNQAKEKQVSGW